MSTVTALRSSSPVAVMLGRWSELSLGRVHSSRLGSGKDSDGLVWNRRMTKGILGERKERKYIKI